MTRPARTATPIHVCGFCLTGPLNAAGQHSCRVATRNGNSTLWRCTCEHCKGMVRCLDCGSRDPQHVDPESSICNDPDACQARQTARTEANPVIMQIRKIQEKRMPRSTKSSAVKDKPAKAITPGVRQAKAVKEPKDCLCGCGDTTGGGNFRPGHDARHVSNSVKKAMARPQSEAKIGRELKAISDKLGAKYEKALALAKADRDKPAKPKTTATKSAAAPAAKGVADLLPTKGAAKKAAAKPVAVVPEPEDDEDDDLDEDDDEDYEDDEDDDEDDD